MRSDTLKDPYDCQLESRGHGEFALRFLSAEKKLSIILEDWWIELLAEKCYAHLNKRQSELNQMKKALKGE